MTDVLPMMEVVIDCLLSIIAIIVRPRTIFNILMHIQH